MREDTVEHSITDIICRLSVVRINKQWLIYHRFNRRMRQTWDNGLRTTFEPVFNLQKSFHSFLEQLELPSVHLLYQEDRRVILWQVMQVGALKHISITYSPNSQQLANGDEILARIFFCTHNRIILNNADIDRRATWPSFSRRWPILLPVYLQNRISDCPPARSTISTAINIIWRTTNAIITKRKLSDTSTRQFSRWRPILYSLIGVF